MHHCKQWCCHHSFKPNTLTKTTEPLIFITVNIINKVFIYRDGFQIVLAQRRQPNQKPQTINASMDALQEITNIPFSQS